MKTIIAPTDFSDVSLNAVNYAVALTEESGTLRIVLYHSTIGTAKSLTNDATFVIKEAEEEISSIIEGLKSKFPGLEFIPVVNDEPMYANVIRLYQEYDASLIVMGITGKNKLEQKIIGSNTVRIALKSGLPVLIVPPVAQYKPVERIAVALQFKENLLESVPAKDIIDFSQMLDAELMVLNIEQENDRTPPSLVYAGQQAAHLMFEPGKASFHLKTDNDIVAAITDFCNENDVHIAISIAEEHGFFESLFKGSVTSNLAFYSQIPLLVYKEKS